MIIPNLCLQVNIWVFTEEYSFLKVKNAVSNTNYSVVGSFRWVNNSEKPEVEIHLPFGTCKLLSSTQISFRMCASRRNTDVVLSPVHTTLHNGLKTGTYIYLYRMPLSAHP